MNNRIVQAAKEVIKTEALALEQLAQNLPRDFEKVVDLISKLKGHLIISGVGKSGHIGRKISATLASTGTPSHFVHGTEASHGDLGSLKPGDACLLISNSGETSELINLIEYTRRFSIPLIALSSNQESTLVEASDYQLLLPTAKEACFIGLAPTTSTTMTLALGDAIAIALMEKRAFNSEHFRELHPGGQLGSQVTKVRHLMHIDENIPIVKPSSSMSDTLIEMTSKGFGVAIVTEKSKVIGVITDGDLRRHMDNLMKMSAIDIASNEPITILPDALAMEAIAIINEKKISVLIVVDQENNLKGVLHVHDCLRAGLS